MKILVLGGAGYIGSHTVSELVDAGEEVVIADSLETGHIEAVNPKAKFYQGDIRDKKFIDSVFDNEKIDAVIHFAANSLVGESMTNPLERGSFFLIPAHHPKSDTVDTRRSQAPAPAARRRQTACRCPATGTSC